MPKHNTTSSATLPKRGCLRRIVLPLLILFGACIGVTLISSAVQYTGEQIGLLSTRTPRPTPTVTYTPSVTPTPTDTPIPTATPLAMATAEPTATPRPPPTQAPEAQRAGVAAIALTADTAVVRPAGQPAPFTVAGWNIGLDDADANTIAQQIAGFQGVDLWGIAEVNDQAAAPLFETAAEHGENADFGRVLGQSGEGMRLLALYDTSRFDLLSSAEFAAINTTGTVRAPLVLHLRDKASRLEFLFMVNHLYRSKDDERLKQAQLLNQWVRSQTLPVIAVGDYNFDWSITGGEADHDAAYDAMTASNAWQWVRPKQIVTSQCSGWPCTYNSVLDFVFAAGPAQQWPARSAIVVRAGDFPDDKLKSDHRPVLAQFAPAGNWDGAAVVTTGPGLAGALQSPAAPVVATAAPAATPIVPVVAAAAGANVRSGPGPSFAVQSIARAGQPLVGEWAVVGRSTDGAWLKLANGGWINAPFVTGVPAGLAVVEQAAADVGSGNPAVTVPTPVMTAVPPAAGQGENGWTEYTCDDNPSPPPNPACPIKGNISSNGQIYHMPGQRDYCKTVIDEHKGERWFCSAQEAEAAGWRAAKR